MTAQYSSHVVSLLMNFYLDENTVKIFNGKYDLWLTVKGHMNEYFYLMMKPDPEVNEIIAQAKAGANVIRNSPLAKAMSEEA